jgi:large subunit ribosomal protein L14
MIGMRTILEVADNSGAKRLMCILPRGGDKGVRAGLGDIVTASVKEAAPQGRYLHSV